MKAAIIALLLALIGACDRDTDSLDLSAARVATPVELDARSQLDLARALDRVERGESDLKAEGYDRVIASFRGKRYRWSVQLIAPLCRADRCNVLAFEGGGRGVVGQSWMPRLELEGDQQEELLEQCAGKSPCEIQFEGRLARMTASTEQFTSVAFDRVEILR